MYTRLDDALLDHRKIFEAGELLGKDGPAIALGFYTACILYSNKHLTDGLLADAVVRRFGHVRRPEVVAHALVRVNLLERLEGGYRIHDFDHHNPTAEHVQRKRARDRARKRHESGANA